MERTVSRTMRAAMLLASAVVVAGCGSSHNSGSSQVTATAKNTTKATVAGVRTLIPALITASSAKAQSSNSVGPIVATAVNLAKQIQSPTRAGGTPVFYPGFNLWGVTTTNTLGGNVTFYNTQADATAGTNSVGTVVGTATGLTSAAIVFNVTGGSLPTTGTVNATVTGQNTYGVLGDLTVKRPSSPNYPEKFHLNLSLSGNQITGTVVATSCITVTLSNVVLNIAAGTLTANVATDNGFTGTITANAATGGTMTLMDASHNTTTTTWDATGAGTIHYSDGTTETISNFDVIDPCS